MTGIGRGVAEGEVNWDEGNSYASASSLALSARDPGSRPGSAAGAPPGASRLGPSAGLGSGSADLSDLDANPFAAGAAGNGDPHSHSTVEALGAVNRMHVLQDPAWNG